ncbi:DUF3168 domain-containing protein [Ammoniphilus sp. YIM 78166]|uniref:DUF3168 domain-containing protein n=1 Tax=Ammoniphilus sp. YIM 78166 TaxID=1644106 RepID=UPI0010702BE4|nr:DUF3168 domain-containing protein [Ammoniphilus sp. YIM 78166]
MTALDDVQKALYEKLTGDVTLMGMISGVFDYVPDGQPFPYVTINDFIETPFNSFGKDGKNVLITVQIWSNNKGFKEAFRILSRLNGLLDDGTITLTNHKLISLQYESAFPGIDEFDGIRQVPVRYRCLVQEV